MTAQSTADEPEVRVPAAHRLAHIAFVCPYDMSVNGGVQSHIVDVVGELQRRHLQVSVLAPVSDKAAIGSRFGHWPTWLTNAGSSRKVAINGSQAPVRIAMGQRRQVREWLRITQPDVLHVHEPYVPALALQAVSAGAAEGVPVIGTFHAAVDSSALVIVASPLLRRTSAHLSAHIAVSAAAEQTIRLVAKNAVVEVIANPVDVPRFANAVLAKPQPETQGGRVLFLGRGDEPRKGLADLLAAWPLVRAARPHAELILAGRMTAPAGDLRELGITVLGEVSEADKPAVYSSADIYAAPHRGGESMGLVLVEAMASGTAVVATDLPAFVAVADAGRAAELVPVADPVAFARAIVNVLSDHDRRESLIREGLHRAEDFAVSHITDELLDVYQRCIV